MKRKPRIYYTESQKALMWERWKKGESLQQIAQLFDRNHSSISRILAETGGIRPAQRCRSQFALSLAEREEISRALATGRSIRSISSISKKVRFTSWLFTLNFLYGLFSIRSLLIAIVMYFPNRL